MGGTIAGGLKAAKKNKEYDPDFYKKIGRKGGAISRGGGFAQSHELAVAAGRKGGAASRRGPNKPRTDFPHDYVAPTPMEQAQELKQGWIEKAAAGLKRVAEAGLHGSSSKS